MGPTLLNHRKLLVVDDEPTNLRILKLMLQDDYQLVFAKSGDEAIRLVGSERPDLVLMDVMMPGMTGFEACKHIKADPATAKVPVIFVTALKDEVDEATGFECGGVDYITKPLSPAIVMARVRNHLSLVQADELKSTRLQIIQKLGRAAEYKDNETGMHVMRMSHYSRLLALAHGFPDNMAEDLLNAAPMHDIGKIGIADHILLKPGKLTPEEFAIMQRHPQIGAEILGESDAPILQLARSVALHHHEKWDGSGYPFGLAGKEIPVEARIVAIADVFDALTSERPYKKAWTVEAALELLQEQSGKHFDPELVQTFWGIIPEVLRIKAQFADT
ncbi:MAG: two-component system response regulator [Pseudomonadales bacterium]|nr:two-component system response regulator [Pseudomonadales bacterium]